MTKAANLLETLNLSREETISKHYGAALAELREKIRAEPLRTTFRISAGCVSKDITNEIARRLNAEGIKAIYGCGYIFYNYFFLTIETALPSHLVIEEKKEVIKAA